MSQSEPEQSKNAAAGRAGSAWHHAEEAALKSFTSVIKSCYGLDAAVVQTRCRSLSPDREPVTAFVLEASGSKPAPYAGLGGASRPAADGGQPCLLFAKRQCQHKTPERIEQESAMESILLQSGFTLIPVTIPTKDSTASVLWDGSHWTLHPFVSSSPPFDWSEGLWTPEHARAAGEALFWFHESGRTKFHNDAAFKRSCRDAWHSLADGLPGMVSRALELVKQLSPLDEIRRKVEPGHTFLVEGARRLSRELVRIEPPDAELGLIHGDYHPGNLLFDGSRVVAVTDLDYAGPGWAAYDVAYGSTAFALHALSARSASAPELTEAFLSGYKQVGDLPTMVLLMSFAVHLNLAWFLEACLPGTCTWPEAGAGKMALACLECLLEPQG